MDPAEILTFFVNGFYILFLLPIAIIVRFRDPKNALNRSFYNFYLYFSLGFIINIIYRFITLDTWKIFLIRITIGIIVFSFVFLLHFNLVLFDENRFNRKFRWITLLIWLVLCSGFLFIDWDDGVNWIVSSVYPSGVPYWSTIYAIYGVILSQTLFVFIFLLSRYIKRKIKADIYKSEHFTKNLAIFFFDWFLLGNILNNWEFIREEVQWFATFMFYSSFLALPGIILFYVSIIGRVEEKN